MSDFTKLYNEKTVKTSWGLPGFHASEPAEGAYRNLLISWNALPGENSENERLPAWFLCCDVLQIDRDILLHQDTFVFARRIEVAQNAGLILSRTDGNSQNLMLFAQEVIVKETGQPGTLPVTAVGDDEALHKHLFAPKISEAAMGGVDWKEGANAAEEIDSRKLDPAFLHEGEPLRKSLETLFQVATLLSASDPELSIAQLRWIVALASVSDEASYLASQAQSLAMTLAAARNAGQDTLVVPQLDLEIYSKKAEAFLGLLQERQTQWERIQDRQFNADLWQGAAQTLMDTQQNALDLNQKLEGMAEETYRQVQRARAIAARQLSLQDMKVMQKKYEFDAGVLIWQRRQKEKVALDIVMGIVNILTQLPTVLVAGPEILSMPLMQTALKFGTIATDTANSLLNANHPIADGPNRGTVDFIAPDGGDADAGGMPDAGGDPPDG